MRKSAIALAICVVLALGLVGFLTYQPKPVITPAEKAQQRLDFLEKNGASLSDQCDAAKAVTEAYVDAQDAKNYQIAKINSDLTCQNAAFQRTYGP